MNYIDERIAKLAEDFCEDNELDFRKDYSGRNMFGSKCIGIVCEDPLETLLEFIVYIMENYIELESNYLLDVLGEPKYDNMAFEYILYFPNFNIDD